MSRVIYRFLILIIIFTNISVSSYSQILVYKLGECVFTTKYDTNNYSTSLRIYKEDKRIFKESYDGNIVGIREIDLNNDGKKEILVDMYSGGAHCCNSLFLGRFTNGKFSFIDTIFWGNAYYSVDDLNKDGKYELNGNSDEFAYAFTNYAESKFPLLIYKFDGSRFVNITSDYKDLVNEQLEEFREDLKAITDTGFQCLGIDEDTFNTDAGSVKTVLSAMVADYYSLGNVNEGYALVDSVYKCADRDKFKDILQKDYKLN